MVFGRMEVIVAETTSDASLAKLLNWFCFLVASELLKGLTATDVEERLSLAWCTLAVGAGDTPSNIGMASRYRCRCWAGQEAAGGKEEGKRLGSSIFSPYPVQKKRRPFFTLSNTTTTLPALPALSGRDPIHPITSSSLMYIPTRTFDDFWPGSFPSFQLHWDHRPFHSPPPLLS